MPNGAKPDGMSGSLKPPVVVTGTYIPLLLAVAGPNTSTVPALKLVANRKTPLGLVPKTRPLYTAPFAESSLSTAITACVKPALQAETVPSSVSKMNIAGVVVCGTRKVGVGLGFHTTPVGAAGVGFGGCFGSTGLQAVEVSPFGRGILTCSGGTGCGTPVP